MDSSLVVTVSSRLSRAWNFSSMLLRAKKVARVLASCFLSRRRRAGDLRTYRLAISSFTQISAPSISYQSANRHRCYWHLTVHQCRSAQFKSSADRSRDRSNNQYRCSLCGPPRRCATACSRLCVSSAEEHSLLASCPPPPRRSRSRSLRRARRQLRPCGRLAGTMRMLRCRRRS